MKNLLIITQKIDEADDLLGFFVDWVREFSKKFEHVYVITLAKGTYDLPNNVSVYSLGKEKNSSTISRILNFYTYLFRLVPCSSGIFAHMSPVFVLASWPAAFIFRKKIILWYLHRSVTLRLRLAEKLCYKIVTAAKDSLKFKSSKIIEMGHGINPDEFKVIRDGVFAPRLKILSVGRISKIKNYDTLLEAAQILKERGVDFEVTIIGQPVMSADTAYLKFLESLKARLDLGSHVNFAGFVPHDKIAAYYKKADIVVGLTPDGGIDKAILESMAAGCITLTSNTVCKKYFDGYADDLIFQFRDPADLAEKIISIIQLPSQNKKTISDALVQSILRHHQTHSLIDNISSLYV